MAAKVFLFSGGGVLSDVDEITVTGSATLLPNGSDTTVNIGPIEFVTTISATPHEVHSGLVDAAIAKALESSETVLKKDVFIYFTFGRQ